MRPKLVTAVAMMACLAAAFPAWALKLAEPVPIPDRVALGQVIVVGKVTAIEDRTVNAKRFPTDKEKGQFGVAVIEVTDGIMGAKAKTKLRVGFIPPPAPMPGQPQVGSYYPPVPTVGQEACWCLSKHFDGDFYVAGNYYDTMDKKSPNFEKDVALMQRCVKLLASPDAGLKAKDPEDRLLTAKMLIVRYRTAPRGVANPKTEVIGAEESKLILEGLTAGDWSKQFYGSPSTYFHHLGLKAGDGWTPPKDNTELAAAAQKWLKENAGKYRIEKFVMEKPEK